MSLEFKWCRQDGRVGNKLIMRRFVVREKLSVRVDRKFLKRFGHLDHMSEEQMIKIVVDWEVEGRRAVGSPRTRCLHAMHCPHTL